MSNSTIAFLISIGIIVFLLSVIVYTIAHKDKNDLQRSGSFASMAAMHDMGGKDEQNAIETVIEQQSEKKWKEQESGEGNNKNKI